MSNKMTEHEVIKALIIAFAIIGVIALGLYIWALNSSNSLYETRHKLDTERIRKQDVLIRAYDSVFFRRINEDPKQWRNIE